MYAVQKAFIYGEKVCAKQKLVYLCSAFFNRLLALFLGLGFGGGFIFGWRRNEGKFAQRPIDENFDVLKEVLHGLVLGHFLHFLHREFDLVGVIMEGEDAPFLRLEALNDRNSLRFFLFSWP